MTRTTTTLALLATLFALTASADAFARSSAAPTGVHPFMLRADEPAEREFSRTPAFAWNPVRGATRYEFQLSTSSAFRDNGIVYSDTSLTTPVSAPELTLPWISGKPHALYARVRAVLATSTTEWSRPYGFDMEPPEVPTPLPSYPGLLRWTPVDGAAGYEVWLVDVPKIVATQTNVLDEREFYSFHQAASWLGQVRWRIRSVRNILNSRVNGLPAATRGPWSPVYTSVNPPFAVGPVKPVATVSDIVATGSASASAHRLMPAFVFSGNQPIAGAATELYRVYVFTDKRCINDVYTSAIIGSPAYAPRYSGPLVLPRSAEAVTFARGTYLPDGKEGDSYAADGTKMVANESLDAIKPTVGLPGATSASTPAAPAPAPGGTTPPPSGEPPASGAAATPGLVELLKFTGDFGPPVGLWDTDWSNGGGYYWTVVPVKAVVAVSTPAKLTAAGGVIGGTTITVDSAAGFTVGDSLVIGNTGISETVTVTAIAGTTITFAPALKLSHPAGDTVVRQGGNLQYHDAELAQDACAAGRVMRFGKESEPTLTAGGEAFVSGLTPGGKLGSAEDRPAFYGSPLVAWTPALGAETYAVQWSKKRNPFKAEVDPGTTALGIMTLNTSAVLPLEPGTWYYRVRGYDYTLPLEAQAMSWSALQQIVVTPPTFVVVGEDASEKSGQMRILSSRSTGLSIKLPSSFRQGARSTAAVAGYRPLGQAGSKLRLTAREAGGAALFIQTRPDRSSASHAAWVSKARASAARAGASSCSQVSLAAGAALRCTGTKGTQASTVYLLQHRSVTYTLTFAGKPSRRATDSARFAAAARSLRFTR